MAGYWNKVLNRRVSRRRALIGSSTTAAAAAFLAACSDDENGGGSTGGGSTGSSSILINGSEVDTTNSAKRGGVWKAALQRDPQNFDLYNFDPFSQGFANVVGSKLVWIKPSRMKDPDALEVVPDLATWEISPDKLTYTFKISPNAKFSPLSPTFHQGAPHRSPTGPSTAKTWRSRKRFGTVSSNAGELVGERGGRSIRSTPDKSTVVFKLKQPFSPFLTTLGNASVSYFYILPKEGDGQDVNFFNKYQFGSGPFYIDAFEPSIELVLKRNPNYELRDVGDGGLKRPYVDEVNFVIVPDAAAAAAQYRAGQLYQPGLGLSSIDDILQAKKDIPDLMLRAIPDTTAVTEWFGMSSEGPWKDERVRQAVHYGWDYDAFIDVIGATAKLEAAGIPFERNWNTAIPGGGPGSYMYFPGMHLDPRKKEFGENAKYFTLGDRAKDIAEAKKLLGAAGFANGFEFKHIQYPLGFGQQDAQDVIEGMLRNRPEGDAGEGADPRNLQLHLPAPGQDQARRQLEGNAQHGRLRWTGRGQLPQRSLPQGRQPVRRLGPQQQGRYHRRRPVPQRHDRQGPAGVRQRQARNAGARVPALHGEEVLLQPLPRWHRPAADRLAGNRQLERVAGSEPQRLVHVRVAGHDEEAARVVFPAEAPSCRGPAC